MIGIRYVRKRVVDGRRDEILFDGAHADRQD
jgi:hypothetical protein